MVDGSMTINREPDGSVSFRVIIADGPTNQLDLLELIIGPEHFADINGVPVGYSPDDNGEASDGRSFPCLVGFRSNALSVGPPPPFPRVQQDGAELGRYPATVS